MLKLKNQKEFIEVLFNYCENKNYSIIDIEFENESAKVIDNKYDDIFDIYFDKTNQTFKEIEVNDNYNSVFDWINRIKFNFYRLRWALFFLQK